jgi:GTP:adenosylcobinamide-phosphate guanylyltransferase
VTTFDAILPAGGTLDAEFAAKVGTSSKALIEVGGQTVLRRTIEAVRAGSPRRVVVAGTEEVVAHPDSDLADLKVPSGHSGPDSILKGLNDLLALPNPPDRVLIVTTDLPFITGDAVRSFLEKCPESAAVCVPLLTAPEFLAMFPGSRSLYMPLKDGDWTAGCAYLMDVAAYRKALPDLEHLFQVRKSKIGMVKMLGLRFLIKFLTKTLTVEDVEAKILQMLQCQGKAVLHSAPELAYDIDNYEEYVYARERMEGKR